MEGKKVRTERLIYSNKKMGYHELKSKAALRIIEFDKRKEKDVLQKLREEFKKIHAETNIDKNTEKNN